MKPVSSLQHQPSPASIGPRSTRQVVAVEVEADLQAQRVARAEPGGHGAAAHELVPERRARPAGAQQQLDAVLAGVAGAAHEHLARPPGARVAAVMRAGSGASEIACTISRAQRALDGEHRVVVDPVGHLARPGTSAACARNQARSRSWLEALVTVR